MKNRKKAVDNAYELLEEVIENFMNEAYSDNCIRMDFLEQSAKYMGVYVENNPVELQDDRVIN